MHSSPFGQLLLDPILEFYSILLPPCPWACPDAWRSTSPLRIFMSLYDQATAHCARLRYRWGCAVSIEIARPSHGLKNPEVQWDGEKEGEFGEKFAKTCDAAHASSPKRVRENPANGRFFDTAESGLKRCSGGPTRTRTWNQRIMSPLL